MLTIRIFPLFFTPEQVIRLPYHSKFLYAGRMQRGPIDDHQGSLAVWYLVNTKMEGQERKIRILPTGPIELPEDPTERNIIIGEHLATVIVDSPKYPTGVWHIFDATT